MQKPPIVLPVELGVSIEDMFRPVDRAAVPELADLLDLLAEHHPLVLAAVADVDRSLIWAMQENAPLQNLDNCAQMARDVASITAPAPSSQSDRPAA
mgnify:CR=1 FL=1|jgi:hypothetical protein